MAKGYGRPPMGRKGGKGMGMGMPGLNMDMIKQENPGGAAGKGVYCHRRGWGGLCHGGRQAHLESPHH